jgi:hypothetical protein
MDAGTTGATLIVAPQPPPQHAAGCGEWSW